MYLDLCLDALEVFLHLTDILTSTEYQFGQLTFPEV